LLDRTIQVAVHLFENPKVVQARGLCGAIASGARSSKRTIKHDACFIRAVVTEDSADSIETLGNSPLELLRRSTQNHGL
jgi:hypothetical protein